MNLDTLGKFLMDHLRDRGIWFAERALSGEWHAPALTELQSELSQLPPEQAAVVLACVARALDGAIHDFLFALTESSTVQLRINGEDAVSLSDGIHAEAYGDDGWIERYSKYDGQGRAV